jgi:hypothetical protein
MTVSTSGGASAPHTRQLVCTLAEGHYFYGVAVLVNSLVRTGFEGTVAIGFRGERPNWLQRFARDPKLDTYAITPSVQLRLIEVPGPWHLNNCKPTSLRTYCSRRIRRPISSIILIQTWSSRIRGGVRRVGPQRKLRATPGPPVDAKSSKVVGLADCAG